MSTTTTTTTKTAAAVPLRNPKDSMKSTWRQTDKSTWDYSQKFFDLLNMYARDLNKPVPVHKKTEKVPVVPDWQTHVWILAHSLPPVILHQAYIWYTGKTLHPIAAYAYYHLWFQWIGIHQIQQMCRIGHRYGYLDGDKHDRDEVPDVGVRKVFWALASTSVFRSLMAVMLSYRRNESPVDINLWALPIELAAYPLVLDFWFYWYHRVMHQFDSLWKYHRTHHLTKHPNPLLTLYADSEQEIFDICGIPLMAYFTLKFIGLPMGFYEWWICQQYVVFTELAGHSGLRIYSCPPSPIAALLRYLNCELAIEDHDLHHRTGWKNSHNYGKQSRLWDRVFGTFSPRIETPWENLDWENNATIFVGYPWLEYYTDGQRRNAEKAAKAKAN